MAQKSSSTFIYSLLVVVFLLTSCSAPNETVTSQVAVSSTPTTISPTAIETPVPLAINPEHIALQILFEAQNVPYQIVDGKIVVDDASTSDVEKIVLNPESGKVIETNDGLTSQVITATDKDNNRVIFVEGYGWVKDVITSESSLQNRVKIPYSWTEDENKVLNTALNTIVSLHYAENPTIAPDALDPHDWITAEYYGGPVLYLSFVPMNGSQVDPEYKRSEVIKSFVWSGVFETTAPNGQDIIILAQTRKNATPEKPNQLINLFAAYDKATYEKYVEEQGVITNSVDYLISHNEHDLALVFSPPMGFDWAGSNLTFAGGYANPTVANLYQQGETFSLLRTEDQRVILGKLNKERSSAFDYSTRIPFIPPEFALKIFYAAVNGW